MNDKQRRFAEEYIIDLNATQAAIRAGYSEHTANEQGARLLAHASVKSYIDELKAKRSGKTGVTAERVLQELRAMAFYDPKDYVGIFDRLRGPEDLHLLPEHVRRAITGWSWDKDGRFVLKLADKARCLELIGKHLKMFTDKVEVSGNLTLEQLVAGSHEPKP